MTTPTQLRLSRPEWFRPVPHGSAHYVPVLQNKPGELDALANASQATWSCITPVIVILGPKVRESQPFKPDRIGAWVKKVSNAVGQRPCFLDTLRVRPADVVGTAKNTMSVWEAIYANARRHEMSFVPVLRVNDRQARVNAIRGAVECDGRGVAVRYPLLGSASAGGRGPDVLVKDALSRVGADVAEADLLLDLGFLDPDVEIETEDLQTTVEGLISIGGWRSVVLMGSAMYRSLGDGVVAEGTVGRLPRREWSIWCALRESHPARLPTYGDYAVQHPDPPWEGEESGPGMRANIRYTLEDVTVVPRGIGPLQQEGAEQYRRLCRQIVAEKDFAGPKYTWGDALIVNCANGVGSPGNQNRWRGAGTSHHLRFVVDQLAALT